jgi:hypothetical protein
VVFRHLMGTSHRKALFVHLDKLFDENVLLGSGLSSKEMLRSVEAWKSRPFGNNTYIFTAPQSTVLSQTWYIISEANSLPRNWSELYMSTPASSTIRLWATTFTHCPQK